MRGAVGAGTAQVLQMLVEQGVDHIDFQGVLAQQTRLHRQDLFLDSDGGRSVGLRDAVQSVVGEHFH
jgi:hypothetical protein